MISDVYILGIDPGLANCGFTLVKLLGTGEQVVDLGVIQTEKSAKKRAVRDADDNSRRTRELARFLLDLCETRRVVAICAESLSYPRNSSAAAKIALCWGAVNMLAEIRRIPILQATPQEIKLRVAGNKSASKEEVQAAMCRRYGQPIAQFLTGLAKSYHEHPYDALASVAACLDSDVVRMARSMVQE